MDFQADLKDLPSVREIIRKLPLSCAVFMRQDGIYCEIGGLVTPDAVTTLVDTGDLAFCPDTGQIYFFLMPEPGSAANKPAVEKPVVLIGKTLASMAICRRIKSGDKADIAVFKDPPALDRPSAASDSRKLSQSEIDDLVKKLLAERNQKKN